MFKNYIRIAWRNFIKNKLFIFTNLFGLGIAIATSVVGYLNWKYSEDWDKSILKQDTAIYRIQSNRLFHGELTRVTMAPMALAGHLQANEGSYLSMIRVMSEYCDMRVGETIFSTHNYFVDPTFFSFFSFKLKHGNPKDLYNKGKIFIADDIALKYYKTENVVGKPLTQIVLGKDGVRRPKEFIIGGVYEKPKKNSSFDFSIILHFDNFWDVNRRDDFTENSWNYWAHGLFVHLPNEKNVAVLKEKLKAYLAPQNKARQDFQITEYALQPLATMMKDNHQVQPRVDSDYFGGGISKEAILFPNIMAILFVLLACFNLTNTGIAIGGKRLKEIGIRKVIGANRRQLVLQFMGENLLLCFAAMLVGLLMAEILVPAYNSLWSGMDLKIEYAENAPFYLFLAVLIFAISVASGLYSSLYISSFPPIEILKGTWRFSSSSLLPKILLAVQVSISVIAIITGYIFYQNNRHQEQYDLGFGRKDIITVWLANKEAFEKYKQAIQSNKDIVAISPSLHQIQMSYINDPIKHEGIEIESDIMEVGAEYMDAMNMKLISGRNFIPDSETDKKESVIVSERLVREFGWRDNPIGKKIVWQDTISYYVIGVMKDPLVRMFWQPVKPLALRMVTYKNYPNIYMVVRTAEGKQKEVNDFMKKKYEQVFSYTQYNSFLMDEALGESNDINRNIMKLFIFLGGFALLMTGIGLYTLVSLNMMKRMKEIGVRKVFGAPTWNLIRVIHFEFVVILFIGGLLGLWIGIWSSEKLMSGIWQGYHYQLAYWQGLWSLVVITGFAFLTVGYKTMTTVNLNPSHVLRNE